MSAPAAAAVTATAVAARSLSFNHPSGRRGVVGVDLEVHPGERVLVLGPNGSGKSTLVHLLAGLLRPARGSVSVLGSDPTSRELPRRKLGVALDRVAHWEPLSALQNLVLLARAAGMRAQQAAQAGTALLARFEVDPRLPVREFSLGMRRKLLLAEALVHEPDVILLDEPTLGLDPGGIDALAEMLEERSRAGAAAVIASNDVRAAASLGARVVFLVDGGKVADASTESLLASVRSRTRLEVTLAEGGTTPEQVSTRRGAPPELVLHPDGDVLVADSPSGAEPLPRLLQWLLDEGGRIRDVRVSEADLGDVFRQLTGKSLEEGR